MAATQKKKQQEGPAPQVEARIDRMVDGDYKTKAYASVTIAGAFAVNGLRVIETDKGRFISMPQESYTKIGETARQFGIVERQNLHSVKRSIGGACFADSESSDRNALRHLYDRMEAVDTAEIF